MANYHIGKKCIRPSTFKIMHRLGRIKKQGRYKSPIPHLTKYTKVPSPVSSVACSGHAHPGCGQEVALVPLARSVGTEAEECRYVDAICVVKV